MVELGYTQAVDVTLVADSQDNRKGHYGEDNNIYLNDANLNNTKDLATTLGHETSHAIDNQDPSINTNPQNNTSKADNEIYAQNYGDDFSDYVEFASENYGDGNLADTNNNNLGNTPAERQRNQKLINSNNQDYAGIDKSKGEDFVVTGTLTAAAIYAAIVGDGNPVDGLETIGQGNDPLTKVIAQGSQAVIKLSYEHFPEATENTLDLIAQVGNGLDVTVKYIDNKTGNVVSAQWDELDKATQDQIKGASKIVSVVVPAGSVRAIGRLKRSTTRIIENSVLDSVRIGSANKLPDGQHGFNDIIDNYAGEATRFDIPTKGPGGSIIRTSELRQIQGSNNGTEGIFEWIIDQGAVTHRRFIPGGRVTGLPNQIPGI
ncbi:hypothetical protein BSPWISOX_2300 [uncultured Gammaproteobacteria bacterium]|nr:hypothetical protein BSPWISOX_2300 [uncultured Gammaproteobacteria bacterium]